MPALFTPVNVPTAGWQLTHRDGLFLIGSCFTDNIGQKFAWYGFRAHCNPFGVVYNPLSVSQSLRRILLNTPVTTDELSFGNELWFHYDFHSSFSGSDKSVVVDKMNHALAEAHTCLSSAKLLIITWGSAWVYRHKPDGRVVANCHKRPDGEFTRELLSPESISDDFIQLCQQLKKFNPDLCILLTISPVRHLRDGATGNQMSKASLFLAMQKCLEQLPDTEYFPAYEIMMDELRDYRFYADDLVHPSALAVDCIWEKFAENRISNETQKLFPAIDKLQRGLHHRPFNADTDTYRKFTDDLKNQVELLEQQVPGLKLGDTNPD